MSLHYLQGDATVPQAPGVKIIAHICNNLGGWGKGFVLAISKRWKGPEEAYRAWHRDRARNDFGLGAIQVVQVNSYTYVANMIAQQGMKTGSSGPPIRYEALELCLTRLAEEATNLHASIHMPRIGTGLAGGKWEEVAPILERTVGHLPCYIYDFS